jgi:hypothetical protein
VVKLEDKGEQRFGAKDHARGLCLFSGSTDDECLLGLFEQRQDRQADDARPTRGCRSRFETCRAQRRELIRIDSSNVGATRDAEREHDPDPGQNSRESSPHQRAVYGWHARQQRRVTATRVSLIGVTLPSRLAAVGRAPACGLLQASDVPGNYGQVMIELMTTRIQLPHGRVWQNLRVERQVIERYRFVITAVV